MSRFGKAASKIKAGPLVLPLFLVFAGMFIVSLIVGWEDYTTSKLGYEALPTRKANDATIWAVAAIPQLGQVGFAYAWGKEYRKNRIGSMVYVIAAIGLHCVDVGTDMVYKSAGQGLGVWFISFLEAELLYTLGSEIMMVVSFGMLFALFPEVIARLGEVAQRLGQALDQLDGSEPEVGYGGLGGIDDDFDFD